MIVMLKMNRTEYGCKLQRFPTSPQFAKSRSDVVCLSTGIKYSWKTPGIAQLQDINRMQFMGQDVCCCLSQIIPGILHENDNNNHVISYS